MSQNFKTPSKVHRYHPLAKLWHPTNSEPTYSILSPYKLLGKVPPSAMDMGQRLHRRSYSRSYPSNILETSQGMRSRNRHDEISSTIPHHQSSRNKTSPTDTPQWHHTLSNIVSQICIKVVRKYHII